VGYVLYSYACFGERVRVNVAVWISLQKGVIQAFSASFATGKQGIVCIRHRYKKTGHFGAENLESRNGAKAIGFRQSLARIWTWDSVAITKQHQMSKSEPQGY